MSESGGVLINQVIDDSAADEAGLEGGDIVVEMNGTKVTKLSAFRNRVASTAPNSKIDLKVFRNGKYKNITAIMKSMDGDEVFGAQTEELYEKLGVTVVESRSQRGRRMSFSIVGALLGEWSSRSFSCVGDGRAAGATPPGRASVPFQQRYRSQYSRNGDQS